VWGNILDRFNFSEDIKEYLFYAVENTSDWVIITDRNGFIEYANRAVEEISGYSVDEIIGKTPSIFKSGLYSKEDYKILWDTILSGKIFRKTLINRKKHGELFQINHTIIPVIKDGEVVKFVSIAKDISKELSLEQDIKRFKYFDALTGLLNRHGFIKEVERSVNRYRDVDIFKVILVLDISKFSHINAVYGKNCGDRILCEIGDRLKTILDDRTFLARYAGDRFLIFIVSKDKSEIANFLKRLESLFQSPFYVNDNDWINLDIKVGIKVIDDSHIRIDYYLQKAELALNIVKNEPGKKFRFYNEEINKKIADQIETLKLIKESIDNRWFTIYLQPIYDISSLRIVSLEALVRIKHPDLGIIYPDKFINILENSEYLKEFERILLELVEKSITKLQSNFDCFCDIAINISMNSFKNRSILETVKLIPEKFVKFIKIEITERVFAEDHDEMIKILTNLKKLGFCIEIDDFGTGFSSLNYIDKLPVDIIKIDMSFVWKIGSCKKTLAVVKNIINLARDLGIKTVAEGVETKEQYLILKELACDMVQGYYFCKPMPLENLIEKIKNFS
jgi:diguanylate cyclase (GGDEF)-like protein/PAS domain S-box-containing protein